MAKVVGYCRISKDEAGSISILTQENAIRDWCRAVGHELVAVYRDEGVSGGIAPMDRPSASQAIRHACKRGFGMLVVSKLDRVSRDLGDTLNLVDNILGRQAALISISESFDGSTPSGRMFLQLLGSFAEFERNKIRQRTCEALATKRRMGVKTGGYVPFGYSVMNRKLIPNPKEMIVVERALELRASGLSLAKVSVKLNKEGLHRREGLPWTRNKLYEVLKSESRRRAALAV